MNLKSCKDYNKQFSLAKFSPNFSQLPVFFLTDIRIPTNDHPVMARV